MCGISGIITKDPKVYQGDEDMRDFLSWQKHRGPDSSSFVQSPMYCLGHNRLSILDLTENGVQPMESERWVLSYNGEIYGYKALRSRLSHYDFKSGNDSETLLFCLQEYGLKTTLDMIEGMYAFAAYDKIEEKLYLVVDPLAIKPIYYYEDKLCFAFASTPGALTQLREKWDISLENLYTFLAIGAPFNSMFEGITKLHGGFYLEYDVNKGERKITRWYEPKLVQRVSEVDVIDACLESIRLVQVADVPVFVFLSGGIDSTVVASQSRGLRAVHLDSPERVYAEEAARKYEMDLTIVDPVMIDPEEALCDYSLKSGDPTMAGLIPYITAKEISKIGKVAIIANGADELFFGYDRINKSVDDYQRSKIFRMKFEKLAGVEATLRALYGEFSDPRWLELYSFVQFDLNRTLDFASMCHSVEVRVPYLNRSVVETAISLPMEKHVKITRKYILKSFLESQGFSREFVNRPKVGFSLHKKPHDLERLQNEGIKLLLEFGIDLRDKTLNGRDQQYLRMCAAGFYCWFKVWEGKIK